MLKLEYKNREVGQKNEVLRKNGFIPAVFYGKKQGSTPIAISFVDFKKIWKQAGESSVVTLSPVDSGVSGAGSKAQSLSVDTLIQDVSVDPLSGAPIHADFYVYEKGKKIDISLPLEFMGVSPAVKDLSGNLVKVLHEIKVSSSPENLPHDIKVDISSLVDFDSRILASDLVLPAGVSLRENAEEVVASVTGPKAEEVDEAPVAVDLSAIEVEKKGKKEEEAPIE